MSSPVINNIENVPDKNSGPGSPSTDKSASFTSAKLKRGNTVERPSSETHSNPDLIKTKENSRPKSCGEELLVPKTPLLGIPKSRESTPQNIGNAWFVTIDDKNRRSRSASKTSAKESDIDKKHGKNTTGSKNSSSGIPLPKRQNTLSKVSSKSSTRPPSKSKLQRSPSSDLKNSNSPNRRSLELQFSLKKKRLECLKKELIDKQKPVLEVYQNLTQLKKKLEESGKTVHLEEMKFIDCNEVIPRARTPLSAGKREEAPTDFEKDLLKAMKEIVNVIPKPLTDMCKSLMTKRVLLVDMIDKYCNNEVDSAELHKKINFLKTESSQLEQKIENANTEQSKQIEELVTKWQQMLESHEVIIQPPPPPAGPPPERFHELYKKFKKQDHEIKEYKQKVEDLQNALNDRPEKADLHKAEENIRQLNSQLKELDAQLIIERKNSALGSEAEKQLKLLRTRVKELDTKRHEAETKIINLQKTLKQKEDNMKTAEKAWEAEKQELIKINNQDKQLLNKLTKDRGFLETRVKTLAEIVDENEKSAKETEEKCREEVRRAKQQLEEEKIARETMEKKYEYMRQEFFKMEVTNQQAIDLVVTKKEGNGEGPITTEREAELYTELLATRVALKAAEDKVKNYAREKLRFIDTIEKLSSNSENNVESLAASLVHKEEEITLIEKKIEQYEELVRNQKMEIANLNANVVNMEQRLALLSNDEHYPTKDMKDSDLNYVLRENRLKLDEMLRKSLDYEQKIIKYDHDFEMQQKQIYEMDNLLKVRDGLIGMLKAKKDELYVENESLTKYANEIRDALMETKEELAVKQEEIQQLYGHLEQKSKMLIRQDKKIKDLKDTLSSTNEKRYKLQDTLGAMEKELQSTKAHVSRMSSEIQARTKVKFF
ncbi:myosin-9-like isoform X2 [Agrilus planipennis]|uniref:Myosin-9-like isoform X2 n=1 Tax=Agrilus planipennis TaxID=224129 RepID=A0A1W4X6S8_AGRPL|nr:myosin-9-like isoform X2 [Agrilus planipennis]